MDTQQARSRLQSERSRLLTVQAAAIGASRPLDNGEIAPDALPAEKATETIERELDESVAEHATGELAEIDAALARLDTGSYGMCEICGKPIGEGRLEILPATRYCVEDAAKAVR